MNKDEILKEIGDMIDAGALTEGGLAALRERARQILVEKYQPKNDEKYRDGELVKAAIAYGIHETPVLSRHHTALNWWPWERKYFKPGMKKGGKEKDPTRTLTKGAALYIAELDRRLAEAPALTRDEIHPPAS